MLPSFLPLGPCSHTVQKLKLEDISAITVKTLKVIPDRIIDNYNKRQQLRFKCVTSSLTSQNVTNRRCLKVQLIPKRLALMLKLQLFDQI